MLESTDVFFDFHLLILRFIKKRYIDNTNAFIKTKKSVIKNEWHKNELPIVHFFIIVVL